MMQNLGTIHAYKAAQGSGVTAAIRQASATTGVDFNYLLKQAEVESSLNPNAKAKTSSATGLYQFIEQTWLQMVKNHGADHGLGQYADAISRRADGKYVITDRSMKAGILNLRRDPQASSMMAAELASDNHDTLKKTVRRDITGTDLYLAHFMGAEGASNFLNSMKKNPWAPAASLFPEAARSNRGVFYENGKPLSLREVYNKFDSRFESDAPPVTDVAQADTDGAATDTFMRRVILPLANDWSNPALVATATPSSFSAGRIGGFLSSSVDVVLMAQQSMRFEHDDNSRYNS